MKSLQKILENKKNKIRDITISLNRNYKVSENSSKLNIKFTKNLLEDEVNMSEFTIGTHVGTHLDSPLHFIEKGKSIYEIDLDDLVGEVFLIDLSKKKRRESIEIKDISIHEEMIKNSKRLIIRTDWSNKINNNTYYRDFPYISLDLAKWIADKDIKVLGLESPSLNIMENPNVHKILLEKNIYIIESLANLKGLRDGLYYMVGLPLKIEELEAAPIRVILIG